MNKFYTDVWKNFESLCLKKVECLKKPRKEDREKYVLIASGNSKTLNLSYSITITCHFQNFQLQLLNIKVVVIVIVIEKTIISRLLHISALSNPHFSPKFLF